MYLFVFELQAYYSHALPVRLCGQLSRPADFLPSLLLRECRVCHFPSVCYRSGYSPDGKTRLSVRLRWFSKHMLSRAINVRLFCIFCCLLRSLNSTQLATQPFKASAKEHFLLRDHKNAPKPLNMEEAEKVGC
jgi:hypothetical protein